ncbi:DUF6817 domain-containing protein [Wenzhouxiangella sp. EGI_FJ10409]|uniref:DUF6817 domain-containing protein n=1 Tax=Wenzhouxiangella sp. EGI_FJ10409 TaxID=3243767 RepID=UPI0035DD15A0
MSPTGNRKPETGNRAFIPQTNLQLYRAMRDCDHPEKAVQTANQAWLLAIEGTAGMFRGSGKPFACHLAGVAGLLCLAGQKAPVVIAGILHAMYQRRVPFQGLSLSQRKERLAALFGEECERLVSEYHDFEVERLEEWTDEALRDKGAVVLMRVADDLEDMLDDAIDLHGSPEDPDDVRGGAAARRSKALGLGPELKRAARVLECDFLEQQLDFWLSRLEARQSPSFVRTGQYSSFSVALDRQ